MMTLGEYLKAEMARPWDWGGADCCTHLADWVLSQTGVDPMLLWRYVYSTDAEAEDLIAEAGGLLPLVAQGMDPVWRRCTEPGEGAAGVISLPGLDGIEIEVGAIHTGKRWSLRSPRGIAFVSSPLAVRAIWAR